MGIKLFAEGGGPVPFYYPVLLDHGGDSLPSSQYLLLLQRLCLSSPLSSEGNGDSSNVVMFKTLKCPVRVVWVFRKTQWIALFSTDLDLLTNIAKGYGY
ncbi:MAG: hypothetical protein U9N19_05655 [Thermodesulfobacteriota bacterium]|nr:hypothetical protein [Thermodesulfobacteriota bacterium]